MADTKTTALTDIGTPSLTDIMYIVDDPGGTPNSEKVTVNGVHAAGDSRSATLTNKTINADNNTVSNIVIGAECTGASTALTDTADLTYNADSDVSGNTWVLDEDGLASDSATRVATQQSVKAYSDQIRINTQTGTTYTLVIGDQGKVVEMNNASANTVTIPTNASVAFPTGARIDFIQYGAGATTIEGDTGVTVNGVSAGSAALSSQYSSASIYKRGTDEWIMVGDHATVA